MQGLGGWVTNDPEIAAKLRKADRDYERGKIMCQGMTLGQKIEAHRALKETRQAIYDAVIAPPPNHRCPRGVIGCYCGSDYCRSR